jgi:hypothetical protein
MTGVTHIYIDFIIAFVYNPTFKSSYSIFTKFSGEGGEMDARH